MGFPEDDPVQQREVQLAKFHWDSQAALSQFNSRVTVRPVRGIEFEDSLKFS